MNTNEDLNPNMNSIENSNENIVADDVEEEEEEAEVEQILDKRLFRNKIQYLVKWRGHDRPTWEKEENCFNCLELIAEFAERASQAPPPPPQLSERVLTNIFGITDTGGRGLVFLVKFQDKQENELLPWIDMREHFACQAMDFFKSRIHWPQEDEFEADDSDIE